MFFTPIEEWIGLLIACPFCVFHGYIMTKLEKLNKE